MEKQEIVKILIATAKKNNDCITEDEILKYIDFDSEDYEYIEMELDKANVEIIVPEDVIGEADVPVDDLDSNVSAKDPIYHYLKDITRIPLLTIDEERKYAEQVFKGMEAEATLESRNFTPNDYPTLVTLMAEGKQAKEKMINANLRLVVSIAKRLAPITKMPFMDLIQEGNMGLIRAVEKFDYRKNIKFSTYATWWVRQGIGRAINEQSRTIRLPVHLAEFKNKLRRKEVELTQNLGRTPTDEELAEELEITVKKLNFIKSYGAEILSLETKIGDDQDATLGDFIADDMNLTPDERTYQKKRHDDLYADMSRLSERDQIILRLRFGLDGEEPYTLEMVGQKLNITRERVRQIETIALRKLRKMHDFREASCASGNPNAVLDINKRNWNKR